MTSLEKIQQDYPLHWLVWNNDYEELDQALATKKVGGRRILDLYLFT